MKRWIPLGLIALLLLALGLSLCQAAVMPERFTGEWYAVGGQCYIFRYGVVENQGQSSLVLEGQNYCGAYAFSRDTVAVFAVGVEGLDQVRQLHLIRTDGGDALCDSRDGSGQIFFYRSQSAARNAADQ